VSYEATAGHHTRTLTVFRGPYINLSFQDGPIREQGVNGTTNEEVIEVLIDRITSLNQPPFKNAHNDAALDLLRAALGELMTRTVERQSRGVEGTLTP
jgi:hypothetical protein